MSGHYYNNKISMKRIRAELKQLQSNPNPMFKAEPTEEDMFHWRFAIRGTPDSSFEGGIYYGRIILPTDYPLKAPNIIILTPNGRFSIGQKICLNVSAYHPEEWHPAWTVRTILEALIIFMPTSGEGAIGSIDWTEAERRNLAKKSHAYNKARGFTEWFELESVDMAKQRAAQEEFSDQAHQAHVHTVGDKSGTQKDTANKKPADKKSTKKKPADAKTSDTKISDAKPADKSTSSRPKDVKPSPKPKPIKKPESQAPTHTTLKKAKQTNSRTTKTTINSEEASDPMLFAAIAVFVAFLTILYKVFLTR